MKGSGTILRNITAKMLYLATWFAGLQVSGFRFAGSNSQGQVRMTLFNLQPETCQPATVFKDCHD
jgi:hypothetical protein